MRKPPAIVVTVFAVAALVQPSDAATIRVPEDAPTIQAAIDAATHGDHIDVAPGHYLLPAATTIGNFKYSLVVNKNVTLRARELYQTVLDGAGDDTVLMLIRAAAHVEGFVLQNAFKGLQQRYSRDVTWTARNLIVRDVRGQAFEINDVSGQIGTAVISNVAIDRCNTAFGTNDARGFYIRNALVMNSVSAFGGFDHRFINVSFTALFNNTMIEDIAPGTPRVTFGPGVMEAEPDVLHVTTTAHRFPYFPGCSSPLIDAGHPDVSFDDAMFPPSMGSARNDIGAYGGPGAVALLATEERETIARQAGCVQRVAIDIKPGSLVNPINVGSRGLIPVAILTTSDFDSTTVDVRTVRFGFDGTETPAVRAAAEDVDSDGDVDLLLHFAVTRTGITCAATVAGLTGRTRDGLAIEGSDSIRPRGC
jgi:hypothetical protein